MTAIWLGVGIVMRYLALSWSSFKVNQVTYNNVSRAGRQAHKSTSRLQFLQAMCKDALLLY